jgi:hypothetical protein
MESKKSYHLNLVSLIPVGTFFVRLHRGSPAKMILITIIKDAFDWDSDLFAKGFQLTNCFNVILKRSL